jgi:D-3-phosphoglycerate dehydrogenase
MKIAILDDYQDCVRDLACFSLLERHDVKVFTNRARGLMQLALRPAEFEALVLNRERTPVTAAHLQRLPKLRLISQRPGLRRGQVRQSACLSFGSPQPR